MGDYLYYVTASNRVAKRTYKSVADLEREIAALGDGEDDAELDAQLAAAKERASKGMTVVFKGVRFARNFTNGLVSKYAALVDIAAGLDDGATWKAEQRLRKEEDLKRHFLAEQEALAERFKQQEAGDIAKAKEQSKLAAAAKKIAAQAARDAVVSGIKRIRRRRNS